MFSSASMSVRTCRTFSPRTGSNQSSPVEDSCRQPGHLLGQPPRRRQSLRVMEIPSCVWRKLSERTPESTKSMPDRSEYQAESFFESRAAADLTSANCRRTSDAERSATTDRCTTSISRQTDAGVALTRGNELGELEMDRITAPLMAAATTTPSSSHLIECQ